MNVSKQDLSSILSEIATYMRLAGFNDFKAIAFDRAARTFDSFEGDLNQAIADKTLTDIKGIGKSIANDIYAYAETGEVPVLVDLKAKVPEGLIKWTNIPGLGPKKIYKIYKELGITTIEELKEKCLDGTIAGLSGMGKKSADKILKSIEWMEQFSERCLISEADDIAQDIFNSLKDLPGVEKIEIAGSLRRRKETIGDIDILIGAAEEYAPALIEAFASHGRVTEILGKGDTKSSVRTTEGRQVDLRVIEPTKFAAALMYFTGSKEHNVVVRQRARQRNMSLNEYGLFKLDDEGNTNWDAPMPFESEADLYRLLDLNWVPPELREDYGEISFFEENETADLLETSDIKGILHAHSTYSDGKFSIEEMARACIERGYSYLGMTDHSKTAAYAGGLSIDEVKQQWEEIDEVNARLAGEGHEFLVLKGIESDILPNGDLDYPEDILQGFDFIIASVHSSLEMPLEKMMERFTRAIENPYAHIIGHPTGRLLLRRDGSKLDMSTLVELAAKNNTAIEINANPWRLDLDWRHGNKAREVGLMSAICPDAHTVKGIDYVPYGVDMARKARFSKQMILNAMPVDVLMAWFKNREGATS